MDGYQDRASSVAARIRERMRSPTSDGLLLAIFRKLFGRFLLVFVRAIYAPLLSRLHRPARQLAELMTETPSEEDVYWVGIDLYKLLMTTISIFLYVIVWCSQLLPIWRHGVAVFATVFVAVRLVEYVATVGLHFFERPSKSARSSFRPVANAFWSYIEFAVLFGVLFASICVFDSSAVASSTAERPLDSFLGPLYLSFTTLATIGCEFMPQSPLARAIAMTELFVGMFLIVAIVQKAVARTPQLGSPE